MKLNTNTHLIPQEKLQIIQNNNNNGYKRCSTTKKFKYRIGGKNIQQTCSTKTKTLTRTQLKLQQISKPDYFLEAQLELK